MYLGLFIIRHGKHADTEIIFTKEEVYTHSSLETRGTAFHAGPHREVPVWVRKQEEEEEKALAEAFIVVFWGKAR